MTYARDIVHFVARQPGGFVDEYDSSGNLMKRIATEAALFAPWGITLAPAGFGSLGGDLLRIGQFRERRNLDLRSYNRSGSRHSVDGRNGPIVNDVGCGRSEFRTGGTNDNPNDLYLLHCRD